MDIKSLMIGDWVYNKHHGKNIRLTPYDFFTHTHNEFGGQELAPFAKPTIGVDLEAISITSDILEKNGFTKHAYGFSFQYFKLYGNLRNDDTVYFTITINGKDITIDYIHQLQHALRLCGIEKEIEL